MPLYEHTVIARPDLSGQQAQALADQFGQVLTEQGGTVGKVEYWGLRNLAFRVKKNRKGHYLHINVEAPAAAITELERTQRINEREHGSGRGPGSPPVERAAEHYHPPAVLPPPEVEPVRACRCA
jgi:ribosomal protein S6